MKTRKRLTVTLQCCECGLLESKSGAAYEPKDSLTNAKHRLLNQGWRITGDGVYCRRCRVC